MVVGELVANMALNAKGFIAGVSSVNRSLDGLDSRVKVSTTNLTSLGIKLAAVGTAAYLSVSKMSGMISEIQSINRRMNASIGSAEGTARAWAFLRKTSNQLGISLEDLASNYGSLSAAAMGTNLSTKDLENIFTALSQKAAILGMSSDRVRLTFLAIEQMASKGVISMEELRRQFGENVPGALGIMARALKTDVRTLNDWVSSGKLLAEDVLPLMADQMIKENIPALNELGSSMQKNIASVSTAIFDLKTAIAESNIQSIIAGIIQTFVIGIKAINKFAGAIGSVFNSVKGFATWWSGYISSESGDTLGTLGIDTVKLEDMSNKVKETAAVVETALISEEEKAKRLEKIMNDVGAASNKSLEDFQDSVLGIVGGVTREFTSFISDLATGVDTSFSDLMRSITKKLLDFVTEILIVRPILEWFQTVIGGISGTAIGGGGFLGGLLKISGVKAFAGGGTISEPVVGLGTQSGSRYLFGEAGPEEVVPSGGSGKSQNISVNINAVDSESLTNLLKNNPQSVIGPIVDAINSGDRGISSSIKMAVS